MWELLGATFALGFGLLVAVEAGLGPAIGRAITSLAWIGF